MIAFYDVSFALLNIMGLMIYYARFEIVGEFDEPEVCIAFGIDRLAMPIYEQRVYGDGEKRLRRKGKLMWPSFAKWISGEDISQYEEGTKKTIAALEEEFGRVWTDTMVRREWEGKPVLPPNYKDPWVIAYQELLSVNSDFPLIPDFPSYDVFLTNLDGWKRIFSSRKNGNVTIKEFLQARFAALDLSRY